MQRTLLIGLLLTALVLPAAALTADEIINKVEDTLTAFTDMSAVYKITVTDAGGAAQTSELKIWAKGDDLRMIKYTSPSSVKGIGFLVLSEDEMYFYSPSRADVRRIAGHARYESFHTTDFTYKDLASYDYGTDYKAELLETTDTQYKIQLTPRSGTDTGYTKLVMWVNRTTWVFDRVDFYDSAGLAKQLTTGSCSKRDGYMTVGSMLMVNKRTGHKTQITISSIDYNTGLTSGFFSQRELKK